MMRSRKNIVRLVSAVVALLVLVGVPLLVTAQSTFFSRYPALSEQYKPWAKSTHLEVGCEGCHAKPKPVQQAFYRAGLVGEFYLSVASRSRTPELFGKPTNESCLACHSDLRTVSPEGDLQIPHRAHVTVLKMQCTDCHKYLVHELSPEGRHAPRMIDCMKCHDGDRAKDTCTACHTEKAAPASHRVSSWRYEHSERAKDPECKSCHEWIKDWCADCHARKPKSHGRDWRATHREQVKVRRTCEACHEQDFCIRCHGEYPRENLDPTLKLVR